VTTLSTLVRGHITRAGLLVHGHDGSVMWCVVNTKDGMLDQRRKSDEYTRTEKRLGREDCVWVDKGGAI